MLLLFIIIIMALNQFSSIIIFVGYHTLKIFINYLVMIGLEIALVHLSEDYQLGISGLI